MLDEQSIAGLPAGPVVQGVSTLGAAVIALVGVAVGAIMTGTFAIIVARMNRNAQLAAQALAVKGNQERERVSELRKAQAGFAAAGFEFFVSRFRALVVATARDGESDEERHRRLLREHFVENRYFNELSAAMSRVRLLEKSQQEREGLDAIHAAIVRHETAPLDGEDMDRRVLRGIDEGQTMLCSWIDAQAERKDL